VADPTGTQRVTACQVTADRAGHEQFIRMCGVGQLAVTATSSGAIAISGASPWPSGVSGTFNVNTGAIGRMGASGIVSNGVPAQFSIEGTVNSNGSLNLSVTITVTVNGSTDTVSYNITTQKS
jgi:hypothetical protein